MPIARRHRRVLRTCTHENLELEACVTSGYCVRFSVTLQQAAGKGSRTVQEAIAELTRGLIHAEHRLGAQAGDRIECVARWKAEMLDDANRRVGVEGAREDRDCAENGGL